MTVRPLRAHALDHLLALYAHLHDTDLPLPPRAQVEAVWTEAIGNPKCRYFGGFEMGRLVSSCNITLIPNLTRACRPYGVIENVVTHAYHRGRGWGRRLLREALAFAWAHEAYKVMLLTGRKDDATLRFYEGCGFSRQGKTGFIARPA